MNDKQTQEIESGIKDYFENPSSGMALAKFLATLKNPIIERLVLRLDDGTKLEWTMNKKSKRKP
jgi:hypothetical protein